MVEGIGTRLIRAGLEQLAAQQVAAVVTYGDPAFYGRPLSTLSEEVLAAPFQLSMPHGWLGQALAGNEIQPQVGRPRCVAAFDKPDLW